MRRILVTGAAGFIGRRVVEKLAAGAEVLALDSRPLPGELPANVTAVRADLAAFPEGVGDLGGVDTVIHLAQSAAYRDFPEGAADVFGVNIGGTFRLLDYARRVGAKRFVFTSSGGVYGYSYERSVETSQVNPIGFYLASKYAAELLVGSYRQFFATAVLRPFFVYGAGQRETMLIPRLVGRVLKGEPISLNGPEGIRINPLHVSDAAAAVVKAAELDGAHLVNIAGPDELSLRRIGEIIGEQLGREPVFEVTEDRAPDRLVGDTARMREILVAPRVSFAEGVAEVCGEVTA